MNKITPILIQYEHKWITFVVHDASSANWVIYLQRLHRSNSIHGLLCYTWI